MQSLCLQHLEVEDSIVRIVRGDEEPSILVPDSPVNIHTYSNDKYFPEFINNWYWKIIPGILVAVALTTVTIVIILKLKGSDDVSVDKYRKNKKSAYYALASYDNDIRTHTGEYIYARMTTILNTIESLMNSF